MRLPESLRRDRFAEKTAKEYEELLQRLANLTGEGEAQSLNQMKVEQEAFTGERGACGGVEPESQDRGKTKAKRQRGSPMEIEVNLHPFRQSHKSYDHISRSYEERILRRTENEKKEFTFEISTQAEAILATRWKAASLSLSEICPMMLWRQISMKLFSVFGEVAKVEINRYMEKLEANFGFVEFYSEESVANALKSQQRSLIRLRTHETGDELFESELFVERKFNAQESDI